MLRLSARRGNMLPFAIVMMGVILALVVGMMTWFNAQNRRAQNDRWRVVAADAAQSGLSSVLAWARAHVDRTRNTPPEWDIGDGLSKDPLESLYASAEYAAVNRSVGTAKASVGTRAAGVAPGDIIEPNGAREYVLARLGDYFVTYKVRIQPFRVSADAPRQFQIGVAGRVRVYGTGGSGAFAGSRLVADRVFLATVGKQPLSRYAALVDIDQVNNWAPGELVEGPIHINRGYPDLPAAYRPAGAATLAALRSKMILNAPGLFPMTAAVVNHPTFYDTVSVTYNAAAANLPDSGTDDYRAAVEFNATTPEALTGATYTDAKAREIFIAPENQGVLGGKAAPKFVRDPVQMPPNSRARLAATLGVSESKQLYGTDAAGTGGIPWFNQVNDGVYIPTATDSYTAASTPIGGIYVRGQVEIMRMAVEGDDSFYLFQVGYGKAALPRRCYMVKVHRTGALTDRKVTLYAFSRNQKLENLITTAGPSMCSTLAGTAVDTPTITNLNDLAVTGTGSGAAIRHTFVANGDKYPLLGIIFIDYSRFDPIRQPDAGDTANMYKDSTVAPKRAGRGRKSLTGSILCLGDPGRAGARATKRQIGENPSWNNAFKNAEVVCTDEGAGAGKLTVIASGDIFIQNHIVVRGVGDSGLAAADASGLKRENIPLSATRDLFGIVADKQILVGMCAPDTTTKGQPGVVLTGTVAALGDPIYDFATNTCETLKPVTDAKGRRQRYRGSFATEGLMYVLASGEPEVYDTLWPSGAVPAAGGYFDSTNDRYDHTTQPDGFPYTPIYGISGDDGPGAGYPDVRTLSGNPNVNSTRGNLLVFGSVIVKKRGAFGFGNYSYDKDFRFDNRLLSIAPPLFPNSVNIVTYVSRLDSLGQPPYNDERVKFLN